MPALKALGRQFTFGSDDLPLPAMLGVVTRCSMALALWLSLGTVENASKMKEQHECEELESKASEIWVYCVGEAAGCLAIGATFGVIMAQSLRGSIVEEEKRGRIPKMLQLLTTLMFVEAGWNVFGSIASFREIPMCDAVPGLHSYIALIRIVNLVAWGNLLFYLTCGWVTTSSRRKLLDVDLEYMRLEEENHFIEHASDDEGISWSVTRNDWERRCKRMCLVFQLCTCNLFGNSFREASDETYRNVANVMARYFKGMDVVPSDLISALCLLRAEQRALETKAVQAIIRRRLEQTINSSTADSPSISSPSPIPLHGSPFSKWLWNDADVRARAKSKLRVQHYQQSHIALDEEAKRLLATSAHFSPFMVGIYGKLLFTYMNLATGPCQLICPCGKGTHHADTSSERRALRRPRKPSNIMEDDCCSLNYSALRLNVSARISSTIVFANFSNKLHQSPYCITVDRETETVVLAIRGTLSAADMLIDAILAPKPLWPSASKWGYEHLVSETSHVHGGMLQTAETIRQDIEQRKILVTLLRGGPNTGNSYGSTSSERGTGVDELHEESSGVYVHNLETLPDCRGYKFRVIGHSLGAGVASILSFMLLPAYPDLRAIAYSPPGCIFDFETAERSAKWIDSVFVGNDLVPHASWKSLLKLRGQMLECLRRSKVNKPTALRSVLSNAHASDLMYPEDQVPDTFARQQLALKIKTLQAQAEGTDFLSRTPMYAPGRLLHIMRSETIEGTCCSPGTDVFLPVWVNDRRVLEEFIVSRKMAIDHFPNVVAEVLQSVAAEHCDLRDNSIAGMMPV